MHMRHTVLTQIVVLAALTLTSVQTALAPALAQPQPGTHQLSVEQRGALHRYAIDVWRSLVAMTYSNTGLPADNISTSGKRERRTSPTNIASSIWSTLAARDLNIITPDKAHQSIGRILNTLSRMGYHQPSGMFYNWYDPKTGGKLSAQNPDNRFLSAVDNGWLATALMILHNNVPQFRSSARVILDRMNFGAFYDQQAELLRGGFWENQQPGSVEGTIIDPSGKNHPVFFTGHHYDMLNSEPRIASYIGIIKGDLPSTHYSSSRFYRTVHQYRWMKIVPSWGGSMFEALMVPLFVPEAAWGPKSWGVNHPCYVRAQIEHGLFEAQYGYWGFSPSSNPAGKTRKYREYGVDAIGRNARGYYSNNDKTPAAPSPPASAYTNGVVTPHAIFLALPFAPDAALQNLANLRRDFKDAYGRYGFYDAINVQTGQVAQYYLALDQGMIMAAIANQLGDNQLQGYFANDNVKSALEPLLREEVFGSECEATP